LTAGGRRGEDQEMAKRTSLISEFLMFVRHNKAYWMIPIVVIVLLLAGLVYLGGTAAAPFIYTLF
jgi:hypothetical protein